MSRIKRSLRSDRHETAAQWMEGIPWGGTSCQAQSERPKRGSRRSIIASKVAANLFAQMQRHTGPKRRRGSGWQDRGGMGTNLSTSLGLVVLCLLLRRSPAGKYRTTLEK